MLRSRGNPGESVLPPPACPPPCEWWQWESPTRAWEATRRYSCPGRCLACPPACSRKSLVAERGRFANSDQLCLRLAYATLQPARLRSRASLEPCDPARPPPIPCGLPSTPVHSTTLPAPAP